MADVRGNLWPEEGSGFADLGDAFTERGEGRGVVILRQEANESRAAFDPRLAILKAQHPASTFFVCLVRECANEQPHRAL